MKTQNPSAILLSPREEGPTILFDSLTIDNSVVTDDLCIAQCMSSYFSSVFTVGGYGSFLTADCVVVKKLKNVNCSANEVRCLL